MGVTETDRETDHYQDEEAEESTQQSSILRCVKKNFSLKLLLGDIFYSFRRNVYGLLAHCGGKTELLNLTFLIRIHYFAGLITTLIALEVSVRGLAF